MHREIEMHLDLGTPCVTDDFASRSPDRPEYCFDQATDAAEPVALTDASAAAHGRLSEAWLKAGPAAALISPAFPAGLRRRDRTHRTITILLIDDDAVDV